MRVRKLNVIGAENGGEKRIVGGLTKTKPYGNPLVSKLISK